MEKVIPEFFNNLLVEQYGKEIADPTAAMFNTVPAGFAFVKDATTGKTVLKYTASDYANDTPVIANFITKTNKVVTVSFTVKKNAYPVAISKIKDFTAGVLNNGTKTKKIKNITSKPKEVTRLISSYLLFFALLLFNFNLYSHI